MSIIFTIMLIIVAALLAIGMSYKWVKSGKKSLIDFEWDDCLIYVAYGLLVIVIVLGTQYCQDGLLLYIYMVGILWYACLQIYLESAILCFMKLYFVDLIN